MTQKFGKGILLKPLAVVFLLFRCSRMCFVFLIRVYSKCTAYFLEKDTALSKVQCFVFFVENIGKVITCINLTISPDQEVSLLWFFLQLLGATFVISKFHHFCLLLTLYQTFCWLHVKHFTDSLSSILLTLYQNFAESLSNILLTLYQTFCWLHVKHFDKVQ